MARRKVTCWYNSIWFTVAVVAIFAIGFGLVEAAVVIRIRQLFGLGGEWTPNISEKDIAIALPYFVMLKDTTFSRIFPDNSVLTVEFWREAATMVMLVAVGWLAGKNWRQRLGAWLLAFGIWDIFYYLFIWVFISWPQSLGTLDVLFLLPLPWVSPVWLPIAISIFMVVLGTDLLVRYRVKEIRR